MGIVTKTYLEALISHKVGFPVTLKASLKDSYRALASAKEEIGKLTGAALDRFNKLHVRDADGKFADKAEAAVASHLPGLKKAEPSEMGSEWVTANYGLGKFQVLINPPIWNKALVELKKDIEPIKHNLPHGGNIPSIRFVYNPQTDKLRAWNGYYATHNEVIIPGETRGEVFPNLRAARYYTGRNTTKLPLKVERFLKGLEIDKQFTPKGLNILEDIFVTKSLTGAALEAFNKLHPRGAEGTRIGLQKKSFRDIKYMKGE